MLDGYAKSHGGAYPPGLAHLALTGDLDAFQFVCPSSQDEQATGATPDELVENLSEPGHLSYVYTAGGLKSPAPDRAVLAHEHLENHTGDGINVLYGDGRVEFVGKAEAEHVMAELAAGHNPPRPKSAAR